MPNHLINKWANELESSQRKKHKWPMITWKIMCPQGDTDWKCFETSSRPGEMPIIEKKENDNWWELGERMHPSCWEYKLELICTSVWIFLRKLKVELPGGARNPQLGTYHLKDPKSVYYGRPCTPMFTPALFTRHGTTTEIPERWMGKGMWCVHTMEFYCRKIDVTGEYEVKGKMPNSERQISHIVSPM